MTIMFREDCIIIIVLINNIFRIVSFCIFVECLFLFFLNPSDHQQNNPVHKSLVSVTAVFYY